MTEVPHLVKAGALALAHNVPLDDIVYSRVTKGLNFVEAVKDIIKTEGIAKNKTTFKLQRLNEILILCVEKKLDAGQILKLINTDDPLAEVLQLDEPPATYKFCSLKEFCEQASARAEKPIDEKGNALIQSAYRKACSCLRFGSSLDEFELLEEFNRELAQYF